METVEITFNGGDGLTRLAGTLTTVERAEPAPAAVLLSGSGPLDRNSNVKKLPIDVMRQVADHLGQSGVVTLRYDKRGVAASGGDFHATGLYENVADAAAAVEALRNRPEVDESQVFVVGHSEGALIATELAAGDRDLAGVILLAAPASDGERVLRWQGEQVAATLPKLVRWVLKLLRKDVVSTQAKRLAQIKASTGDVVRIQFVKLNAKWFREFIAHDPALSLRAITIPVLAVVGSNDIQIDPADAERICRHVRSECSHHVIDDMTHLLRLDPGPPSVRTYRKQAKRPVEPELLTLVAGWIADHTRHDRRVTPSSEGECATH